jgi:hypothetical protein
MYIVQQNSVKIRSKMREINSSKRRKKSNQYAILQRIFDVLTYWMSHGEEERETYNWGTWKIKNGRIKI